MALWLALLSGVLLSASFPVLDISFLAWVAFIPLLVAVEAFSPRRAFLVGWLSGCVASVGILYWVTISIHTYGKVPLLLSGLLMLLLSVYTGVYTGLFCALLRLHPHWMSRPLSFTLKASFLWTALELLRTYAFSGFPWALLGYSQYRVLSLIQIADLTGVYGVSFLIVLVNASLYMLLRYGLSRRSSAERVAFFPLLPSLLLALLSLTVVFAYGGWRLASSPGTGPAATTVTVGIVQGNIDQSHKWDARYRDETMRIYKDLTRKITEEADGVDLVVWPEAAVPFFFQEEILPRDDLKAFVKDRRVSLLFGSPAITISSEGRPLLTNSAYFLSPQGEVLSRYDKLHLVPFGEYVPLSGVLFFINKLVEGIGDFIPGERVTVMGMEKGKFGVVICFEVIFPHLVRQFVREGADFMVTITNDAWFGRSSAPYQHFSLVIFRAVENRVPFVRAANTGISGVIDQWGRVQRETEIFVPASFTEKIGGEQHRTFYTVFGDLFASLCAIIASVLLLRDITRLSTPGGRKT